MDFNELYVDTCSSASKLASIGDTENLKNIVDLGKPTNGQDNKGWRALHHACNGGHIECVKILLKAADVDINAITFERETALYLVCCSKLNQELKVKIAEILLEAGADPNHENKKRYATILNQVVSSSNLPLAKLLLKFKTNVNEQDDKYGSTLNAAVRSKSLEMVKLITEQRLEYYHVSYLRTELIKFWHLAVMQKNTDILEHFSKNPQCLTKINDKDYSGRTPLLLACIEKYREGIKILLEHGADPNIKDSDDKLPLMYFAEYLEEDDLASSESLFGKMVKLTNKREFKRPRYCRRSFLHGLPLYEKSIEIFNYLMEHFPDVNFKGVYAEIDYTVLLPMSRDRRDRISEENITLSPLAYCCDQLPNHKNYDMFRKMVEYENDINDTKNNKIPAIITALGNKNPDLYVVEHLVRNGATVWILLDETFATTYPTPLHALFHTPDPSPALELLFAIVGTPERLIPYSDYVLDAHKMESRQMHGLFRRHREALLPITFLKVVCSILKYARTNFFEESEVMETVEMLRSDHHQRRDYSYFSSFDYGEFEDLEQKFLNISRTPRSLQRLASIQIRYTICKRCRSLDIPLFKYIEDLYKQVKLPLKLKEQLLFR